jgi:hypothetical protein
VHALDITIYFPSLLEHGLGDHDGELFTIWKEKKEVGDKILA